MHLDLKNRVVIVSGGARGIGAACCAAFVDEGARVVLADRDEAATAAFAQHLRERGGIVEPVVADLQDAAACRRVVEQAVATFGQIDVLVNNAGFNDALGLDQPPECFARSVLSNLLHAYALAHYSVPLLRKSRGAIVNVSSKVSVTGQGATSGYAAAKGAINALTREWAVALAADGVRVNCVLPAECLTDQYQRWFDSQPDPQAAEQAVARLVPLGRRLTTAEEVAAMIVFLASPRSSHTTGQLVFVDGGYTHLDRAASHEHGKWS
ncbi:MAG TPA: SDR family oxidoreductase [Pirellulales bacterium]|jgi:NAD(P)-dependent dehydrogenase (short-subunit alcohol dehydrogenase family)|nr:SDR family oxidoreductase [Pirellulales bacterium]